MINKVKLYPVESLLMAIIVAYSATIASFYAFGSFDLDLEIIRINVPDPEKPYLILFMATVALLTLVCYRASPADTPLNKTAKSSFNASRLTSWVILIIAVGGLLRAWGLWQGLDFATYHPDALKQHLAIREFLAGNYMFDLAYNNRTVAGYPYFGMHIIEMVLRAFSFTGYDTFSGNDIFFAYRWLNVVYACVMIALVYKIGALLGYQKAGLLGASLLALSTAHNHMCKYLGADIAMSFFALVAVYIAILILKWERNRYYLFFGIVAGLSTACKYNGILIFFFLGFVFLNLHPRPADFLRNAPRLIMSVLVSILTFIATSANILSAPLKAITAIHGAMTLSSSFGLKDDSFGAKINSLMDFDYNFFVIESLFTPVPFWVALLALAMFIYKYRWKHVYLWATPCVIFALGKYSMPISASYHYLNIIPLLLLATAVGIDEIGKSIGKRARIVLPAILLLYGGYYAVQDNSFWLLKPISAQNASWLKENISGTSKTHGMIRMVQNFAVTEDYDADSKSHRIRHFYNVMNEKAVSLHRDSHREVMIGSENKPLIYPQVHFIDKGASNTIYPASHDIVTTDKAFMTGDPVGRKTSVTKFIMAEKPMKRIAVWIKNFSTKTARVTLWVGGKKFKYKLKPQEEAPITIVDDPKRTFLYYGSLIKVWAESDNFVGWFIGVNERDIGDLYLATGKPALAVDAYLESGDLYSLMQAVINSDVKEKQIEAIEKIKVLKPDFFEKNYIANDENFWENVAGYTDQIFRSIMTRPLEYDISNTRRVSRHDRYMGDEITKSAWEINDGGIIYGPYMPLLSGAYKVSAEIMAKDNLDSFVFDISSNIGRNIIDSWTFAKDQLPSGSSYKKVTFEFKIKPQIEYPVEFRFHQIKGGSLLIKNVEITADYLSQTEQLISGTQKVAKDLGMHQ